MKKFLIFFVSLLFLAINAQATIRYVTQNGAGTQDGSSWANASNDFQAIINASHWEGDTIFVAAGTYKPIRKADEYATNNISPNNRTNAFVIVKSISIFGSFAGTETSLDERQLPPSGNYTSILSGDFLGNDGPNFSGMNENAYHVLLAFDNNTTRDLLIDGFTIRGGNANGGNDPILDVTIINNAFWFEHNTGGGMFLLAAVPNLTNIKITGNSAAIGGGGIYCKNSASPVLNNVIISGNRTAGISGNPGTGGGMYYGNGNPVLNNVIVSENSSGYGGGISNGYGLGIFNNVIISGNTASISGGGMGNSSSAPILSNVIISGNTTNGQGGGIYNQRYSNYSGNESVMTNVLISGNTAATGGGMYNANCSPILTNLTVSGNTANTGGGIYNSSYDETSFSAPEIRNSIIWGNSSDNVYSTQYYPPNYSYSLVEGEPLTNGIILNCDPLFDSNFNLQEGSPAINVGNNLFFAAGQTPDLSAITTDLNGKPRIITKIELGAYEWQYCNVTFAGEEINIPPQIVEYGSTATQPATPERAGFTFMGWFTDNNTFLNPWDFDSDIVTQDTTLYAKWEIISINPGATFYMNEVLYLTDTTFCNKNVNFHAEIVRLHPTDPESIMWYIDNNFETSEATWSKPFENGTYEIKLVVHYDNDTYATLIGTLKVQALWIKMRNVRY
jgi:uncharacterized repeat protein (TIGR02543 family)